MPGDIQLEGLTKHFGEHVAVAGIDVDIAAGRVLHAARGRPGCGKTTTPADDRRLRAADERPDHARRHRRRAAFPAAPAQRQHGVPELRACFPHLDVAKNVAFGLKYQKLDKSERAKRVAEALELVNLTEFAHRKGRPALRRPSSSASRLARALVLQPRVLLLDEPTRRAPTPSCARNLQVELKALPVGARHHVRVRHARSGGGAHDERPDRGDEQGAWSSRRRSPRSIYEEPTTVFVAEFLGVSNLLAGRGRRPRRRRVRRPDRRTACFRCGQGELDTVGEVKVMIRPERIVIEPHAETGDERLPGIVERSVFLGGSHEVHVRVLGGELMAGDGGERRVADRRVARAGSRGQPPPAAGPRCGCCGRARRTPRGAPAEEETLLVRDPRGADAGETVRPGVTP